MNKLILATGADRNYLPVVQPYLDSMNRNSNFDDNVLAYLGDEPIQSYSDKVKVTNVYPSTVKALNLNNCVQHGEFLRGEYFNSLDDSDVIVFTDGDIIMQRPMTADEEHRFRSLRDCDVFIGFNAGPDDTLYTEATRLTQVDKMIPSELIADWHKIKIYNAGVTAMNKRTWLRLMDDYLSLVEHAKSTFVNIAYQQWLMCFIMGTRPYNVIDMPNEIHCHRHYFPNPLGASMDENGTAYFNGKKVLFKHLPGWNY
jgi:hypothetical protein